MAERRPALIPGLSYHDPRAALAWLEKALGFEMLMLLEDDKGDIAHAEMRLGEATIMVGSEWSASHRSPKSIGGVNTQAIHIHIETDLDAHFARATAAGGEVFAKPETQFYGDRTYRVRDPEGHIWTVAQTVKAVTREEAEAATGLKITGWA